MKPEELRAGPSSAWYCPTHRGIAIARIDLRRARILGTQHDVDRAQARVAELEAELAKAKGAH